MCGIMGVVTRQKLVAPDIHEGLFSLQHRGQDAAGIVTLNGRFFHEKRGEGLVREVFSAQDLKNLIGSAGIGHVRYRTTGSLSLDAAQPFFVSAPFGMYLVHNGNLTNAESLRKKVMEKFHRHLRSNSDSEVLLSIFADTLERVLKRTPRTAVLKVLMETVGRTMDQLKGAYTCLILIDGVGLLAFRDPHGIRPLVLGSRGRGAKRDWAFASENAPFGAINFSFERDVHPGEAVLIDFSGKLHAKQVRPGKLTPCIFEYIYIARPDSTINDISVYKFRLRLGRILGRRIREVGAQIDVVMPIPDSARPQALEIARELGVPYREGLVKNRYIGRTFIMPDQKTRIESVRRKLNTIPLEFRKKRVLLVDDSIVRGTTMQQIIALCREAGAREVHVASAAPPLRFQNVYGVDIPTKKELVAHGKTVRQIQRSLGADGLYYQTVADMYDAARAKGPHLAQFEDSVFTGKYITGGVTPAYLRALEKEERV